MAIKVVNILKDGTIVEDMSTVTVPKEIMKQLVEIHMASRKIRRGTSEQEKKQ